MQPQATHYRNEEENYTTWDNKCQPWTMSLGISDIKESLATRRKGAPFETHKEYRERSKLCIHALSFNHVARGRVWQKSPVKLHSYPAVRTKLVTTADENERTLKEKVDKLYRMWRASGKPLDKWETDSIVADALNTEACGARKLLYKRNEMTKNSLKESLTIIKGMGGVEQNAIRAKNAEEVLLEESEYHAAVVIQCLLRKHISRKIVSDRREYARKTGSGIGTSEYVGEARAMAMQEHERLRVLKEKTSRKVAARRAKKKNGRQEMLLNQLENL